jgi:hypothetical protein
MNVRNKIRIRKLIDSAKDSCRLGVHLVGNDSNFNRVLLKYPDVLDTVNDYYVGDKNISLMDIEKEFYNIIVSPVVGVLESLYSVLDKDTTEIIQVVNSETDPLVIKEKLLSLLMNISSDVEKHGIDLERMVDHG